MGANNGALTAARVSEVTARLLAGEAATAVADWACAEWHISNRQAWRYVARARDGVEQEAAEARKTAFAETLLAIRALRRRAMEASDWRLALDVLREEAKLLGLYPRQPVEVAPARPWPVTIVEVVAPADDGGGGAGE